MKPDDEPAGVHARSHAPALSCRHARRSAHFQTPPLLDLPAAAPVDWGGGRGAEVSEELSLLLARGLRLFRALPSRLTLPLARDVLVLKLRPTCFGRNCVSIAGSAQIFRMVFAVAAHTR